jgi:hypothetical protein
MIGINQFITIICFSLFALAQAAKTDDVVERAEISLSCPDLEENPCFDPEDVRFVPLANMIESALSLRTYELDLEMQNNTETKFWKYKRGWKEDLRRTRKAEKDAAKAAEEEENGPNRKLVSLRGAAGGEMDDVERHLKGINLNCGVICNKNKSSFMCIFYCGGRNRRRNLHDKDDLEENVCVQNIQLETFLYGYPKAKLLECMESVPCVLNHPCVA